MLTYSAGCAATERSSLRQTEVLTVADARALDLCNRTRATLQDEGWETPIAGGAGVEFRIVTDRGPREAWASSSSS